MRVQASNFQSWSEACLDIEGFTTIVGPSDIGKSSIFRMIKGVFRNDIGANKIKNGENALTVSISFDSNNVTAHRTTKGATTYTVNNEEYGKLAGNVPEVVAKMGYAPVSIGSVTLDPIFGGQFDNQFLLCSSPSDLNTVLGAFSSTEKLDQGKKKIGQKIREIDVEAKVTSGMVTDAEARVFRLESFLEKAKPLSDLLTSLEKKNNQIDDTIDSFSNIILINYNLFDLKSIKDELDEFVFDLSAIEEKEKIYETLSNYRYSTYVYNIAYKSNSYLELLNTKIDRISQIVTILDLFSIYSKQISTVDVSRLAIDDLIKSLEEIGEKSGIVLILSNYNDYNRLLKTYNKELSEVSQEIEVLGTQLNALHKQLHLEQVSKVECPKCGYKFKMEN